MCDYSVLPALADRFHHLVVVQHKAVAYVLNDGFQYREPQMLVECN